MHMYSLIFIFIVARGLAGRLEVLKSRLEDTTAAKEKVASQEGILEDGTEDVSEDITDLLYHIEEKINTGKGKLILKRRIH